MSLVEYCDPVFINKVNSLSAVTSLRHLAVAITSAVDILPRLLLPA